MDIIKDILTFDKFLTPKVITFLYWLLLVVVILTALTSIFSGQILAGALALVFGPLFLRLGLEGVMVIFQINDNLQKIINSKDLNK